MRVSHLYRKNGAEARLSTSGAVRRVRALAESRYDAHAGEQYEIQVLADRHGEDAVLDWLRAGVPTPRLDVSILADLRPRVTEQRYRWLESANSAACWPPDARSSPTRTGSHV